MKGKYLITTDSWFIAPDGKQYKAVWGEVEIVEDELLGIKTNRNSSNWFAKVGTKGNHIIIAGCQIHYAARSEDKPNTEKAKDWTTEQGQIKEYDRPTYIYITE